MNNVFVSIIMPVKNVEKYIRICIDSVLNQTYKNFEVIILDDSDDNTSEIIKSYSDKRIKHIFYSGNISKKLNYGIKIAQHEYICRMDGDDIMNSYRIEKQLKFLLDNPSINLLGTNYYCIDPVGSILYEKKLPEFHNDIEFMMPFITSVLHPTIMIRTIDFLRIKCYDESMCLAEDLDLFLNSFGVLKFHNLQEPLHFYRINHKRFNPQNENVSYFVGLKYLNNKPQTDKNRNNTLFQIGLLEYYKNDIQKALKIFTKLLFTTKIKKTTIFRYLIPSLLGNVILKYLRKSGLFSGINSYLLKVLNYDTYYIKLK